MSLDDDQTTKTPVPTGVPGVPAQRSAARGDLWTADDDADLRTMWLNGLSARKIGERLGRTKNAVIGRVHRLKIPAPQRRTVLNPQAVNASRTRAKKRSDGKVYSPTFCAEPVPDLNANEVAPLKPVSLQDAGDCQCRWPHGDPLKPGFGFCGARTVPGTSWCPAHFAKVYVPVQLKPRRLMNVPPIRSQEKHISMLAWTFDE